jgi:CheY-like chemotaxis protein
MRMLVVSSHPLTRDALYAQLSGAVVHVDIVSDAAAALECVTEASLQHAAYDVVVIDERLDDDTAVGLARRISECADTTNMRLVVMARPHSIIADCDDVDAWIPKPIRATALVDRCLTAMAEPQHRCGLHLWTPPPAPQSLKPAPAKPQISRGTILVVEDNAVNKKVAVAILEAMGYRVDTADDGIEALEVLEHHSYDAVLMDIHMPRLDGYGATAAIRQRGDTLTPVIAMTASVLESDRAASLASGMNDYLAKPIDRAALDETLQRCIRERHKAPVT